MSMTRFGRVGVTAFALASMAGLPAALAQTEDGDAVSTVTAEKDTGKGVSADGVAEAPPPELGFLTGGGIKLSDGLVFHPLFELQTGYQSNVFYEDNSDLGGTNGSVLARISAGGSVATPSRNRMEVEAPGGDAAKPKLAFKGDLSLTWNQYLTGNRNVQSQSDLGIGLLVDAKFNPEGTFIFNLRNGFTRSVLPPSVETGDNAPRDKNELLVGGIFRPGGGAIQAYANYSFGIDVFEKGALSFSNRTSHTLAVGTKWQWLPKTQFNGEASIGFVGSSSDFKSGGSLPLRAWIGTSTLITPTFGTVLRAGYGNGFYSGANFNSFLAMAEGRIAVGPTVRVAFGYTHDFVDALIANFYVDHTLYARFSTQIAGRSQLRARAELRFRDYEGVPAMLEGVELCAGGSGPCTPGRSDILARIDASYDYQFNQWLVLGGTYTFNSDTTDFFVNAMGDLDSGGYVWHELLVKATAKF